MFELVARLIAALAVIGVGAFVEPSSLEFSFKWAGLTIAYSFVVFQADRKGMRNAGVAGFVAVADAALISMALARHGMLEQYGFATLLPVFWATTRYSANPAAMSPLVASSVLIGSNLFGGTGLTTPLLVQAGIILLIGLLANHAKEVVTLRDLVRTPEETLPKEVEPPAEYLEFRESYRTLRDHSKDLERRSRRDRMAMQLFESVQKGEPFYASLARKLKDLTGAQGLTLYSVSDIGLKLVVQSAQGEVPDRVQSSAFEISPEFGDGQIRHYIEKMVLSLRDADQATQCGTVLLKDRGRIVGMVCLFHSQIKMLTDAVDRATEVCETVAAMISDQNTREEDRRRLREAELLYTVAATSTGADTPQSLAARVVRELDEAIGVDGISVSFFDEGKALSIVSQGYCPRLIEQMSFAQGQGSAGWLKIGAPELALYDAFDDPRLPKEDALKKRVGSMAVIPIQFGTTPFGMLIAVSKRVHGIDQSRMEVLRVVGAELGQAIARLDKDKGSSEGLMTPKEFHEFAGKHQGCLVYLEVLRREELVTKFGTAGVSHTIRGFASRMRAMLPAGSALCRRDEGDYVVFLRDIDDAFARNWANDVAATASMIAFKTPDGRAKIPLALRAKVAPVGQQIHQISEETVA